MIDTRPKRIIEMFTSGIAPEVIARRFALPLARVYSVILCDKLLHADINAQKQKERTKRK